LGHELYYKTDESHIGSVSIRRWEEISKLLPLLVDFVNRAQHKDWGPGVARDVRLFAGGGIAPQVPPPEQNLPHAASFDLPRMLSEERLGLNEVYVYEAAEWDRLFAWCDFLAVRDGAFELYRPLVEALRPYLAGMSDHSPKQGATSD
jgi:hypothetical protein